MGINLIGSRNSIIITAIIAITPIVIGVMVRTDVAPVAAATTSEFDETWRDAAVPVVLKTASLFDTTPKPIQTVAIKPEVVVPIIEPTKLDHKPKIIKVNVEEERDICQRHHMHKVYRGRGWRCRK